jgi:glycosyltransferase involved in cell wall biosynthesis
MRFSVDAHAIGQHLTGNETYVRNLLSCFASLDHEADFVTYLCREDAFHEVPKRFLKKQVAVNPFVRLGFDLPRRLRQDRPALLHVQYTAPLFCSTPIVVSVHDVSFLEHPEYFTPFRALQLRCTVRRTVKSAARVITASEFSRRRILSSYRLDEDKVVVLPNGVATTFRPMAREAAQKWVQTSFGLRSPFILTVGDLVPRKNHAGLIRAFESLVRAHPHLPHQLVIVGKENWRASNVRATAKRSSVADRIHFTGFVSDEGLLRLYGACDLFAYPSFYEGFGLPVLDALRHGTPVLASGNSSLREFQSPGLHFFDPCDPATVDEAWSALQAEGPVAIPTEPLDRRYSWDNVARLIVDYRARALSQPNQKATKAA